MFSFCCHGLMLINTTVKLFFIANLTLNKSPEVFEVEHFAFDIEER